MNNFAVLQSHLKRMASKSIRNLINNEFSAIINVLALNFIDSLEFMTLTSDHHLIIKFQYTKLV